MTENRHEVNPLVALLIVWPLGLLDAAVAMYVWNTFVVSAFGVPSLKLISTFGLLVFFNYLITKRSDFANNERLTWEELLSATFTALFTWLVMFVLHFFI